MAYVLFDKHLSRLNATHQLSSKDSRLEHTFYLKITSVVTPNINLTALVSLRGVCVSLLWLDFLQNYNVFIACELVLCSYSALILFCHLCSIKNRTCVCVCSTFAASSFRTSNESLPSQSRNSTRNECGTSGADYLPISVMLKQSWWSLWSPHPPLPLRSFVFLMTLATIREMDFGYNWRDLRATLSTCCTLDITWFDSQLLFLWWTPHSPIWKTRGPFTTITCSFCLRHCWDTCCSDQSQL